MPAVVSDTSPLIYLAALGRFAWLPALFDEVLVPPAVFAEATRIVAAPGAEEARRAMEEGWLKILAPRQVAVHCDRDIDQGELEAIALALELHATLIIDDSAGRDWAREQGVQTTGTLGIIVAAKGKGLVAAVRPDIDRLVSETNFRMSTGLRRYVLEQANETDE